VNETFIVPLRDLLFRFYQNQEPQPMNPAEMGFLTQSFVASHPASYNTSSRPNAGPSGVHLTSADFQTIYNHIFDFQGQDNYYAARLEPSLLAKFNDSLLPSGNLNGVVKGVCRYTSGSEG
jgi:hypothetical protein